MNLSFLSFLPIMIKTLLHDITCLEQCWTTSRDFGDTYLPLDFRWISLILPPSIILLNGFFKSPLMALGGQGGNCAKASPSSGLGPEGLVLFEKHHLDLKQCVWGTVIAFMSPSRHKGPFLECRGTGVLGAFLRLMGAAGSLQAACCPFLAQIVSQPTGVGFKGL